MELNRDPVQGGWSENYETISGSSPPGYCKKRNVAAIGAVVLLIIVITAVTIAFKGEIESNANVLPPLKWEGDCPVEAPVCPESYLDEPPPLLLVSLDGFRPDYLKRGFSTTLQKISRCGSTADFMYPVFPTKTFPNHFSQVTGLYPSSHGIIDNFMFDPITRKTFKLGTETTSESFWWQKEPIWVSAEKQGKRTATFFWPGSDVKINGTRPSFYWMYDASIPFHNRVDQVLKWLDLPRGQRPDFLTLYFDQPDYAAHRHGVHSREVNEALLQVDGAIERLFSGLQQRNLTGCINIFIMSDHGMADISCERVINLQNYTDVSKEDAVVGAFGRLRPKVAENISIELLLEQLRCHNEHMRVYRKEELPVRMHYAENPRIEPVFLELDNGWSLLKKPGIKYCNGGAHGYDNFFPDMKAMFIAAGPSIKKNLTVTPFLNIELYELMCELMGIQPNPNNGTRGSLHHLLVEPGRLIPQLQHDPPDTRQVPDDLAEYMRRVEAAHCYCNQSKRQNDAVERKDFHLPFGIPSSDTRSTLTLLHNDDYITAYDLSLLMPKWISFTLMRNAALSSEDVCWIGDARVKNDEIVLCADYNVSIFKEEHILQRPLFPPAFSESGSREQASYITNSVPKSQNYVTVLEEEMVGILNDWAGEGEINILTGPAFDLSATGVKPHTVRFAEEHSKYGRLLVPTHLFVVATWCSTNSDKIKDCGPSKLETHSFLLPNYPFAENCQNATSVIKKNAARVVDIETLTGLSLYTGLPTYDAIRLRTSVPDRPLVHL